MNIFVVYGFGVLVGMATIAFIMSPDQPDELKHTIYKTDSMECVVTTFGDQLDTECQTIMRWPIK